MGKLYKSRGEWLKNKINEYPVIFIVILSGSLLALAWYVMSNYPGLFESYKTSGLKKYQTGDAGPEVDALLYFVSGIATCVLALIAYLQLNPIKKDIEGTFLLEVVKLYNSPENYEARYLIAKHLADDEKQENIIEKTRYCNDARCQFQRESLAKYMRKHKNSEIFERKYYQISEFLNVLETMGHFYKMGYVLLNQFNELMGSELAQFEDQFRVYISDVQVNQPTAFVHFKELVGAIRKERGMYHL